MHTTHSIHESGCGNFSVIVGRAKNGRLISATVMRNMPDNEVMVIMDCYYPRYEMSQSEREMHRSNLFLTYNVIG